MSSVQNPGLPEVLFQRRRFRALEFVQNHEGFVSCGVRMRTRNGDTVRPKMRSPQENNVKERQVKGLGCGQVHRKPGE